jgi:hypothetical protein
LRDYFAACGRLCFAISEHTRAGIMPEEAGLTLAEIVGEADLRPHCLGVPQTQFLRFAQVAAGRLHRAAGG